MKTLTIKDLTLNKEIDSNDMAAIEGGISKMNITALNLGLALPTGNGVTQNPPKGSGGVQGGDPGSGSDGGEGGDGFFLGDFGGSNHLQVF